MDSLALMAFTMPWALKIFWIALWGLLVCGLTVALFTLVLTRRGRSNPLRICIVLSLLIHALLAGYATTVQIVADNWAEEGASVEITLLDGDLFEQPKPDHDPSSQPWEQTSSEPIRPPDVMSVPRTMPSEVPAPKPNLSDVVHQTLDVPEATPQAIKPPTPTDFDEVSSPSSIEATKPDDLPQLARQETPTAVQPSNVSPVRVESDLDLDTEDSAEDPPGSSLQDVAALVPKLDDAPAIGMPAASAVGLQEVMTQPIEAMPVDPIADMAIPESSGAIDSSSEGTEQGASEMPSVYRLRDASKRDLVAARRGGGAEAQAAVDAGLAWLAAAQSPDGSWDADRHDGGQGRDPAGGARQQAGSNADTGITGLALLAFFGGGHTHQSGDYQETVARGLSYLIEQQAQDGNLSGDAKLFARMYCHGMASFALSEAYAMTGDERLHKAVQRAVDYILAAQHPEDGGWRYRLGDDGDTSQLGWQVMALKSADLAGIKTPAETLDGIRDYLQRVSSGRSGGLASYRPGRATSRTMTAEALLCRQFLGLSQDNSAAREAADYISGELPGRGRPNFYYWYYATLALHQQQGAAWERWNASLKRALIETQRTSGTSAEGDLAGSWDTDTAWGGHGGRVFTTALGTLCLEVYYRFAPLQARAMDRDTRWR